MGKDSESTIKDCLPKEVHPRTGICDLKSLLKYVAIICDGSLELIKTPSTSMTTMIEELIRTTTCWIDCTKDWNLNEKVLKGLLERILEQELQACQNWSMYPTVDEDIKLWKA